ncbi:MAG: hypothetical protein LBV43_06750 [Prevotella sp.]|jgi:carbamoyltransferase|nr:hypothetical protein [Prevotella sp.]
MKILGISCAHDSNICVVEDGEVLVHVEKERITRIRYDVGSLEEHVPRILASIGLTIDDIDYVATSVPVWNDLPTTGKMSGGEYTDSIGWGKGEIEICGRKIPAWQMAHHLGHIATAYYLSPFDNADVLSIDGGGNYTFGLLCKASGNKIETIADLKDQNLGWLWNALAGRIFGAMSAAGKVMGLAPYGSPKYVADLYGEFGLDKDGVKYLYMKEFPDHTRPIPFSKIGYKEQAGVLTKEEEDMSYSLQEVTDRMAVSMLEKLIDNGSRSENLCLSGGVALNCVMNEVIRKTGMYRRIYVPSAPNDSGLSIGFALYLWHNILNNPRKTKTHWHPYRGMPHAEKEKIEAVEKAKEQGLKVKHLKTENEQNKAVVDLLIAQKIVGIHRGRSESGPRALGHRSIVADPRNPEMKDIINAKVKFREAFRPFAPSVLIEETQKYLDFDGYSPYMSFAPVCKPEAKEKMAATIHVDGSARLQTADPYNNPDFYNLIKTFYDATGVPVLLNTSLNTKGEPINEIPMHSLDTLLKSELDALLIDDYLFTKE